MFGLFKCKKKSIAVLAPATGTLLPISEVNDIVFSKKMMGDGFTILPKDEEIVVSAPISGTIRVLPDSGHAIGIVSNDNPNLEVLVHIGLDTVNLEGRGFTTQVGLFDKVQAGTSLVEINQEIIKAEGLDPIIIVIFTKGLDRKVELSNLIHTDIKRGTAVLNLEA